MIEYTPPPGTEFDTRHKIGWPVQAVDSNGTPRNIDGPWELTVIGEGTAAVDPINPNRIEFVTGSNAGTTDVIVQGDADLATDPNARVLISETFRFNVGAAPVPQAVGVVSPGGFEAPALK
jgi:hypothetical protein